MNFETCPTCGRPATHVVAENGVLDDNTYGPFCESHAYTLFAERRTRDEQATITMRAVDVDDEAVTR